MRKIVRNCAILLQNTTLNLTLTHALVMTLTLTPHPNSNTYLIAIPHLYSVNMQFRLTNSQRYLLNAKHGTNHSTNPTNPNGNSKR